MASCQAADWGRIDRSDPVSRLKFTRRTGARKLKLELIGYGWKIGRKKARRLMRVMGIEALVPKPSRSVPDKSHKIHPYLLRNLEVTEADQERRCMIASLRTQPLEWLCWLEGGG